MIEGQDIEHAYERIITHVRRTPVIDSGAGTFGLDTSLTLKLELLQHSGSFKARGAFNNLLAAPRCKAGVVAASGGNHGAAVAFAAQKLGIPANIFVPEISSPAKIARIKSYGADLHVGGARYQDALEAADAFAARSGARSIHAFDQSETLAGQGTVGLEWTEQSPDLDTILVAVGGGGLIGGVAAWYRDRVKIIAVEPETSHCLKAALAAGKPVDVEVAGLAADSLGARAAGTLMFPIAQAYVNEALTVPDQAIAEAQKRLWAELRIAAEPGGATALAPLLTGAYKPARGERVGVLICGGNVSLGSIEN